MVVEVELVRICLTAASVLLFVGVAGIVSSRSVIRILLSSELLYNAALLVLLALSTSTPVSTTVLSIMVITLATSEVAVLIAIAVLFYRLHRVMDVSVVASKEGV